MTDSSVKEQVGDIVSQAKRRVGMEKPSAAEEGGRIGIVRGAWMAFASGDHDGFIDALQEQVTWVAPGSSGFPGGGELSGPDEVREQFVGDVGRTYTEFGFRPESFVDAEDVDAIVAVGQFEGTGVEGASLSVPAVQIWDFEGNNVTRVRIFADGGAFPEVVTEEKEKEWEEEEKEKQRQEEEEAKGESDSGSEAKSESDIGPDSSSG